MNSLLILQPHIIRSPLNLQLPRILLPVPPPDEHHDAERNAQTHDNSDLGGNVAGGIFWAESLGSCRSANTNVSQNFSGLRYPLWVGRWIMGCQDWPRRLNQGLIDNILLFSAICTPSARGRRRMRHYSASLLVFAVFHLPMMLPTQYPIKYSAATVVFFV